MDKLTTFADMGVRFQKAMPSSKSVSISTNVVTEDPTWSVLLTNQKDMVVVRLVTRNTRLRPETTIF